MIGAYEPFPSNVTALPWGSAIQSVLGVGAYRVR